MPPAPPAASPPPSGPPTRRCAPGSPPPSTATSSSPTRTPGSAASSPAHSATSGQHGPEQVTIQKGETTRNQAASVPSATLSTTGRRRSQPRLTRKLKIMTAYEKKTGWRYSITCTNIPGTGMGGVPGSHHPQYIDVVHREHAVVETGGVRTAKAMGLRNLPSKSWQVNCGWVIVANIAADLAAWNRLLGFCDQEELRDADPETLRYRVWHLPARLARHARERVLKISPDWPWKDAFLTCWQRLCALPAPA